MTIKLDLAPEIESFARAKAEDGYHGDISALVNSLLRYHMECDEEVERKLLEAIDSQDDTETVKEEFWESLRHHARSVRT